MRYSPGAKEAGIVDVQSSVAIMVSPAHLPAAWVPERRPAWSILNCKRPVNHFGRGDRV